MMFKRIAMVSVSLMSMAITDGSAAPRRWDVGMKGGVSVASLYGHDADSVGTDTRTGFVGGGFVTMHISEEVAFRFEGLYAMKGTKSTSDLGVLTVSLDYLEFPLLLVFKREFIPDSFWANMFVGPAISFKMKAEAEGRQDNEFLGFDIDDLISSSDFGGVLGFAGLWNIGRADAILDIRYTVSFVSVDDTDNDLDIKNNAFSAMIGLGVPLGYR